MDPKADFLGLTVTAQAAADGVTQYSVAIETLLVFASLSFIPALVLMMTSFTRIVIVLSLMRQALGLQTTPPNQVIIGMSLFLSFFVMSPTLDKIYVDAYQPYSKQEIALPEAAERASTSIREFMLVQTRQADIALFTSIADLQDEGVTIRYFETGAYMQYLLSSGQVDESQLDGSYDGGPSVFIAEGGAIAQQGFASAEPYNYENVFEDWGKPVEFELIHDAGWQTYAAPLAVLDSKKDELADCMAAFTPIVQAATVGYYAAPDTANELIIQAVNDYADFWVYDQGLADSSVAAQIELGLAGNGPDDIVGNFDEDRLTTFIEIAGPVFGVEGLTPADLITNEYIDETIGFT